MLREEIPEEPPGQKIANHYRYLDIPEKRAVIYRIAAAFLAVWFAGYVFPISYVTPPSLYIPSYYALSYRAGFVRRGLAGEVVSLFPERYYIQVTYTLVWASFAVYCAALGALAWYVVHRGNRAERRILVALLLPVLPFAVTFAVFGSRPELFGAAAFILFSLAISRIDNTRFAALACALYGAAMAVMAFFHELIPIEFALGSVLAILLLARSAKRSVQAVYLALAIGPGFLATALILKLSRRGVGPELCAALPHRMVKDSMKVPPDRVGDYILGRYESFSDYHDWVCKNVIPFFDAEFSSAVRSVEKIGALSLSAGFLHGLLVFIGTIWLIQAFTTVKWRKFVGGIRGGLVPPMLALVLWIPIFATGTDWIRWWALILMNVAVVYLVFAASQDEIERPITARTMKWFIAVLVLLACIPLAAGPGYFLDPVEI